MLDVIDNILKHSRRIQHPPCNLRHLWTYPSIHLPGFRDPLPLPTIAACDLLHFDLYESDAGAHYLRQFGGILGQTIWYEQVEPTTVASASADPSLNPQQQP